MIRKLLFFPPTEPQPLERAAFLAARSICRRHARSFYFASHFLPVEKRYAAYAVYAFCRLIDDAVDNEVNPAAQLNALAQFEARLTSIYAGTDVAMAVSAITTGGRPTPPRNVASSNFTAHSDESSLALYAFAITIQRYRIPIEPFRELAEGCRMDLTVSRYATWADLERYCYRVAGVVGLIMCPIFGLSDPRATEQAVQMGNAMQLTNILRDVKEDWERGRLYLPAEDLERFRYTEADVANGIVDDRFRRLMRFEIDLARTLYRQGAEGLCRLAPDGSRLTASAMAVLYSGILDAIERQQMDVYRSRAHLAVGEKLVRLPRAWKLAQRDAGEPLPEAFL